VVLTNESSVTCTLDGYPGMELLDAAGRPITDATRGCGYLTCGDIQSSLVALRPRANAYFLVDWRDNPEAPAQMTCPTSASALITPPDEYDHLVVPLAIAVCGIPPVLGVSPVAAGTPPVSPRSPAPSAPTCDPGRPGSGIKPSTIFFGCATSADNLNNIVWNTWTATTAIGTAIHSINSCQPNCAQGTYTNFPVKVTLSNPGYFNNVYVFRTISTVPTTSSGSAESATVTCPVGQNCSIGRWGYVPS
jgi:hypothetical protein